MSELTKCSKCQCKKLETFFSVKETTGKRFKTCDKCRNNRKKVNCPECDKTYSDKSSLTRHIKRVHLKIKDKQCSQCKYAFSTSGDLNTHIKQVHDKIKDIKCSQCEYACSTNGNLRQHIKQVHDKIKDIKCPQCEYACSTSSDLFRHIKQVHDKIKDFKCPQCDYCCSQNSTLTAHIKICTGNRIGSAGEVRIKEALESMKIEYQYDTSYEVKDSSLLRWDFIITHDDKPYFIEYDGRQHFETVRFGGISQENAQEALAKQQAHDELKNNYCKDNEFELLRIPYTQFGNIPQILTDFAIKHLSWEG